MALKPTRYSPIQGGDARWQQQDLTGQLLRGEVFVATSAVVTGELLVSETGLDEFAAVGSVEAGAATITGSIDATELGVDSFVGSGFRAVTGSLAVTETDVDTVSASGFRASTGLASVAEVGVDTFTASGSVTTPAATITGDVAVLEAGTDLFVASGFRSSVGSLAVAEPGADTFAAAGQILTPIVGDVTAFEIGIDSAVASGGLNLTFSITGPQFRLLIDLCRLHGLLEPLTVSATERTAGPLVQSVLGGGSEVTIATLEWDTTAFGTPGQMIEELAALHGITTPLVVTSTSRASGSILQSLSTQGAVTTVARQ